MTSPAQTLRPGPCAPWVQLSDVLLGRPEGVPHTIDAAVIPWALGVASDLLYVLSGRQFPGQCEVTVRPTGRPVAFSAHAWNSWYSSAYGSSTAASWGVCLGQHNGDGCCSRSTSLDLGVGPIAQVKQVKIDGVVIPATEYRVDDYRYLVRVPAADGTETQRYGWPSCQDLSRPDTAPGTFSIDVVYGMAPPLAGVFACAALAYEFALNRSGQQSRLPARVTSLTRQGVSMALIDPMTFMKEGLTGVYEADVFISAYNPTRSRVKPKIWSPDTASRSRRQTS